MIKHKITPHIIALATLFIVGTASAAGTWYVDPAGNDSNTCTAPGPAGACMTINAAIGKASPGDTINVATGIYHEPVVINKTLTLRGGQSGVDARTRSGAESVIDDPCAPVQITADNVTLDGFTVQGSTQSDPCLNTGIWTNPGFSSTHGGHQILNNIVQNNISGMELDNDGTFQTKVQFNLIQNNNNPGPGSGNGIQSNFGLKNALIDNNKFFGQTNSSVLLPGTGSSPITISNNTLDVGIAMYVSSGIAITGNSSIGNTVSGTIYMGGGDSAITISSNVLDNGVEGIVVENAFGGPNSNVTISPNNCIAGNSTNGLRVASGGYTGGLNATNNWWGAASGPNYNGGGPGTGDKITDPDHVVSFSPFLSSRTGTPCAPPPVGPPTTANQCKNDGWKTFNTPRTFKNQGDCIQYVNTGK
jgi:nitrous oxidase accessory protein NosD